MAGPKGGDHWKRHSELRQGRFSLDIRERFFTQSWILERAFQRNSHSTATRFQGMFGKYCWAHAGTAGEGAVHGQESDSMILIDPFLHC